MHVHTTSEKLKVTKNIMERLPDLLKGTVSPNPNEIKAAESQLAQLQVLPGFPIALLEQVNNGSHTMDLRLAAAIYFKNLVKRDWSNLGSDQDRNLIKAHIVKLMLGLPRPLQAQVSAAVTLISETDFPLNWQGLVPELVSAITTDSHRAGGLQTLHAVLEKYRNASSTPETLKEMLFILPLMQAEHLQVFRVLCEEVVKGYGTMARIPLEQLIDQLILVISMFYLMNCVDIPEFYQDHLHEWLQGFTAILNLQTQKKRAGEEDESSPMDRLKSQICESLALYTDRYQEPFEKFVPSTVESVWNMLCALDESQGFDQLVASGIRFLGSAASTQWAVDPFGNQGSLEAICERVVLPGIKLRQSDEELFEDNPTEFIRRDIEGADQDTRRRASMDFVKALSKFHEDRVTSILVNFAQQLLKVPDWRAKEACAYVIAATANRGQTRQSGVTKVNQAVDVKSFFVSQLLPELTNTQNVLPNASIGSSLLVACALKFATTFRNFLPVAELILPITNYIESSKIVVSTYAAHCLSFFLKSVEGSVERSLFERIGSLALKRVVNDKQHNEYMMRLLMVCCTLKGADQTMFFNEASRILPQVLSRVVLDPTNPQFARYLCETLSYIVGVPSTHQAIEQSLLPVLTDILAKNLTEFMPYAFQLLAVILRGCGKHVPILFSQLFGMLLSDELWRAAANVPALVKLISAYFAKRKELAIDPSQADFNRQFSPDSVQRILGKIQFLIKNPRTEQPGYELLVHFFWQLPLPDYQQYLTALLGMIFSDFREKKTERKMASFALALSVFSVAGPGVDILANAIEAVQGGLFLQVVKGLWLAGLPQCASTAVAGSATSKQNKKVAVLGLTLLLKNPAIQKDGETVNAILKAALSIVSGTQSEKVVGQDDPEEPAIFEGTFVRLKHSGFNEDFVPQVLDENSVLKSIIKELPVINSPDFAALVAWSRA